MKVYVQLAKISGTNEYHRKAFVHFSFTRITSSVLKQFLFLKFSSIIVARESVFLNKRNIC